MNKGFVALDVTSTSVHLYRAPWMDAAKNEYLEAQGKERLARKIVELVGGAVNVTDCTSCVTRLRVEVADPALVRPAEEFEEAGAHGVMRAGKVIQVVVGTGVVGVKECFDRLVGTGE